MVVFFFAVGELLEGVAAGRARAGIQALAALAPKTALLLDGAQPMFNLARSAMPGAPVGALQTLDGNNTSGATIPRVSMAARAEQWRTGSSATSNWSR